MVDLQQRLGIELTHVPYRGGSELYQGLLGSQIDIIADASGWIPLVQSGQFRLLVVWGSNRMKLFPEVRTLKEAGIDLVVNSPRGRGPRADGAHIRRTATVRGIPCLTTVAAAMAAAAGIAEWSAMEAHVAPLQEYHRDGQMRLEV
jgi:hypothetical protein